MSFIFVQKEQKVKAKKKKVGFIALLKYTIPKKMGNIGGNSLFAVLSFLILRSKCETRSINIYSESIKHHISS